MTIEQTVAVILAAQSGDTSWNKVRYGAAFCGVSSPQRVAAAAREAGVSDVILLVDSETTPMEALDLAGSAIYVAGGGARRRLGSCLEGRRVLAVCADMPLITAATFDAILHAAETDPSTRPTAVGGALAVFPADIHPVDALLKALARFDDRPLGDDEAWSPSDPDDLRRLATPADLPVLEHVARRRKLLSLASLGVLVSDAEHTYVDLLVRVGPGTRILPGTHLIGRTVAGPGCTLGPDSWIEDSAIEEGAVVRYSVLESARVREHSTVGPFAHLRPGADVGPEARVGNFVEVKAARLGRGVKVGHLSYLGDAEIGEGTNVGAGAITCNYDGAGKHRTVVEDGVFIGSNVCLVAPVTIGRGAFVGAGSTITEDVPAEMLALGRARQVLKDRKNALSVEEEE
ncbi:MAG: DapH/DapD/GlmU-related protein [Candidatus Bipolaricaulis sp.]|nr:DapH/DapD/GlmU-related protein [Candidatus Bipolaricaulis sp.]MDD5219040.1 DapH/DapD/GlmU-related protein [Candidatus Bipolaricaulis sp.]MDD5646291.1 DapH/DapD/GlmU-related protein [Candidatus Bipolaricaulis sp.]